MFPGESISQGAGSRRGPSRRPRQPSASPGPVRMARPPLPADSVGFTTSIAATGRAHPAAWTEGFALGSCERGGDLRGLDLNHRHRGRHRDDHGVQRRLVPRRWTCLPPVKVDVLVVQRPARIRKLGDGVAAGRHGEGERRWQVECRGGGVKPGVSPRAGDGVGRPQSEVDCTMPRGGDRQLASHDDQRWGERDLALVDPQADVGAGRRRWRGRRRGSRDFRAAGEPAG